MYEKCDLPSLSGSDFSDACRQANEECYRLLYDNVCRFRDNWVREMEACNWGHVTGPEEDELEMMREICDFIIRTQVILVEMFIDRQVDFTSEFFSVVDAIADVRYPESLSFSMMEREHKKFLPPELFLDFINKTGNGRLKRMVHKHNGYPRVYYQKDGEDIFNHSIFRIFKGKLGLSNIDQRLCLGLEKILGGRAVIINCEDALFDETPITISIKESIGYNLETRKFFIKPETQVKEFVGRLRIDEIPTMTTDNKLWLKYYH